MTMSEIQCLGKTELLLLSKTAFLCSDRYNSKSVLTCYDWAEMMKRNNRCVISGFQSRLEKDVLEILLRGKSPIIIALARGMYQKVPAKYVEHIDSGRLLLVSQFPDRVKVATRDLAYKRNKYIVAISDEVIIGHINAGGMTEKLLEGIREKVTVLDAR